MENKCVICGGPLGENTIPSLMLEGNVCVEREPPQVPCDFLDRALDAATALNYRLKDEMEEFEARCTVREPYNIRRNGGFRVLDCGHLPAIRAALSNLQRVLDRAIENPGGPNVQE